MKKLILSLFLLSFFFVACNKDDDMEDPTGETSSLNLDFTNLPESSEGEQYEGWIIVSGSPVSTGTFTVNAEGNMSKNNFDVLSTSLASATDFVLSIEPIPDDDPAPSAIKILGGSFSSNSASLTASHGAALGDDFSNVAGKYILATPTTTTTDDELSGLWFLDLASGSPSVGLDLPELPDGWIYEGWAVINGMPVTSGTFMRVDNADDSAPYSGMGDGPPFPGEDYVNNAPNGLNFPTDLSGGTMVISIEPYPDNNPAPFMYKPLVGNAPANAMDHVTYEMQSNVSGSFPTGTASR